MADTHWQRGGPTEKSSDPALPAPMMKQVDSALLSRKASLTLIVVEPDQGNGTNMLAIHHTHQV